MALLTASRLALSLCSLAAVSLSAAVAHAAPPTAGDFIIEYFTTNEEGERQENKLDTPNELKWYLNRARCQCGEDLIARIRLNGASTSTVDTVNTWVFLGTQCDISQNGLQDLDRCVLLEQTTTSTFRNRGLDIPFDIVWLSTGVADANQQDISNAEPVDPSCDPNAQGTAGIWICADTNGTSGCQQDEFIIQGAGPTQTTGSTTPSTDPTAPAADVSSLTFDFQPPDISGLTGFRAMEGDGAVELRWDQTTSANIGGFMVLCANDAGEAVKGGLSRSEVLNTTTVGRYYYTAENLCPGEADAPGESDEGGTSGTGGTSEPDGTGGTSASMGIALDTGTTYGGMEDTGTGGVTTSTGGVDTNGGGDTTGGNPDADDPANAGILTLDWGYVCSGYIAPNATRTRIEGLSNGETHRFLVVAFDQSGNPAPASNVLLATPRETRDFWEQCQEDGDICGNGGFCRVGRSRDGGYWMLLLLACGVLRRRRRA